MKTLAWMMVGLIESNLISLNAWAPYVNSRAVQAQSTVRRFARWLNNSRIETYKHLLDYANKLLPLGCKIVLLADRGFADIDLMAHASRLGWHWRIRFKGDFWLYRRGHQRLQPGYMGLKPGQALFWRNIRLTEKQYAMAG